jgi:hypothetical protein
MELIIDKKQSLINDFSFFPLPLPLHNNVGKNVLISVWMATLNQNISGTHTSFEQGPSWDMVSFITGLTSCSHLPKTI